MPPKSLAADTISLGEKIQAAFPNTKVVKTLNTMNCAVMVNPKQIADGNHTVFVSGNEADAMPIFCAQPTRLSGVKYVI